MNKVEKLLKNTFLFHNKFKYRTKVLTYSSDAGPPMDGDQNCNKKNQY